MPLYLPVKVGDQIVDPSKLNLGAKDGYLNGYIDTNSPDGYDTYHNFESFGDVCKSVYILMEVDRKYKPLIRERILPIDGRDRGGYLDINSLGKKFSSTIEADWRAKGKPVDVVDGRFLELDKLIRNPLEKTFEKIIPDFNATDGGTKTVGGAGQDFPTLELLRDDLTTLISLLRANVETAITETGPVALTTNMGDFDFIVSTTLSHGGDPTSGQLITIAHNDHGIQPFTISQSNGDFIVENLKMKRTVAGSNANKALLKLQSWQGDIIARNMFIDGNNLQGKGFDIASAGTSNCVYSSWAYDCGTGGVRVLVATDFKQALMTGCSNAYDLNNTASTLVGCAGLDSSGSDFLNTGSATGTDLMSEDTTAFGTNQHDSVTPGNEFYLDPTLSTGGQPKTGGETSSTDPSVALMDGSWTDEIGPKVREGGGGVFTPYYYQKFLAGM